MGDLKSALLEPDLKLQKKLKTKDRKESHGLKQKRVSFIRSKEITVKFVKQSSRM